MKLPDRDKIIKTGLGDPAKLYYFPLTRNVWTLRLSKSISLFGKNHKRVLEIGFGSGILFEELKERAGEVYGIDVHPYVDDVARMFPEIKISRCDAHDLPFETGFFDGVFGVSVMEHLAKPERALLEVKRVLTSNGAAVFGFPTKSWLNELVFRFLKLFGEHEEGDHKFYSQELMPLIRRHFEVVEERKIFPNIYTIVKIRKK